MNDEVRIEWLALHQARGDGVVQRDGGYFNAGSRIPGYLGDGRICVVG